VKWVEDRTGNLISTGFARDYHMRGELAVKDGKMTGLRATLLSDQGAFYADAQPTKFRAGLFHIVTGSYDIPAAHVVADGWYTNKAPGGVAYRCSFRVTEASYLIERLVDNAAHELGVDPTKLRLDNFIQPEQFPYHSATGFARDYHMRGELAVKDGKMTALRTSLLSDQGAFFADAQPTKFRAGLFHIVTGSYDIPAAHVVADGYYTNKAPGGVAYRCSFRVTEASYLIERLVDNAAHELGIDPARFRLDNFVQPDQFPYRSATGFVYDSGNYPEAMRIALDKLGYDALRKEQEQARAEGRLLGIGLASFTEVVGAGHGKEYDIAGLRMFDSAELRVHPTGKAILKLGVRSQGQGHETTFGQIVAEELGIPYEDVEVQEGDTDNTPYGLGTYASRSTPVAGAATAVICRKLRDKGKLIAAHLLEAAVDDIEFEAGRFSVRGAPDRSKTIQEVAFAAYTNLPDDLEAGLEGVTYYDPPNMTYPFGTYAVVVEIDRGTGQWTVQKMVAVDDCGVRINPMIVEGQIMGGLTEGYAIAAMELITFDEDGNCIGSNFMDYLVPTAWETPEFDLGELVTPSPHHPIGAKGVGESATVGSPAAYVNAVIDALWHAGVRNIDMPVTPDKVWQALSEAGLAE
jgi:carbon-monoxide dehydrogenase large subunit